MNETVRAQPAQLVFYKRGLPVGVAPKTDETVAQMHTLYHASFIQTDEAGAEHWALIGLRLQKGLS
jgi:hypothetical protein